MFGPGSRSVPKSAQKSKVEQAPESVNVPDQVVISHGPHWGVADRAWALSVGVDPVLCRSYKD